MMKRLKAKLEKALRSEKEHDKLKILVEAHQFEDNHHKIRKKGLDQDQRHANILQSSNGNNQMQVWDHFSNTVCFAKPS